MQRVTIAALAVTMIATGGAFAHEDRPWGDGHHHPWATKGPIPTLAVTPDQRAFRVLVDSNLVLYQNALNSAGHVALKHCFAHFRSSSVTMDDIDRYADLDLAQWEFTGHCNPF